jgi:predicted RNase H-like HicB family nuclease
MFPKGHEKVFCDKHVWSKAMREYTVIYERAADGGWGAYVPDLPGLGVVGETLDVVEKLITEGIVIHIEGLLEDGLPIPEPTTLSAKIVVAA